MSRIFYSLADTVGNTPLLPFKRTDRRYNCRARLYAKLESLNPGGSLKTPSASHMLRAAV